MKAYENCRREHNVLYNFYCWQHSHHATVHREHMEQLRTWANWYHTGGWGKSFNFVYYGNPAFKYSAEKNTEK